MKYCEIKDKLLVTSNCSFSHNVFHSYIFLVRQNAVLFGNGLTIYARKITFVLKSMGR